MNRMEAALDKKRTPYWASPYLQLSYTLCSQSFKISKAN